MSDMTNIIESLSQFICTSSGVGIASLGLAATSDTSIINNSTLLPLSLFIGGIGLSAALTWRAASAKSALGYKLRDIERRLDAIEERACCKRKNKS